MKNEDEFLKYSKRVWDYSQPLIEEYRGLLSHKNHVVLLDLGQKIRAYDFGIRMQARTDFRNEWFSNYDDYIKKSDEKKATTKVNRSFQSSFDNERSEKIKALNLEAELMHIRSKIEPLPTERQVNGEPQPQKEVSLYDDFIKAYLPGIFGDYRQDTARKLKEEFQLLNDDISQIQHLAFDKVVKLTNKRGRTNFLPKNVVNLIQFLEQNIEIYFPLFLKDLKWSGKIVLLSELRRSSKQPFNTACHRCGKRLFKRNGKRYCTRKEKRACYEAHLKENRETEFPESILRTKNRCDECGMFPSPINKENIYKHGGKQMQFCSSRCWEAFRKRESRKKKKSFA